MKKEMLINVLQPEECRIAILEDSVLEELYVERTSHESYVGNIYKGRIVNIEPSIQAAFVDFGVGRNGFLHVSDVEPAYYRHLEQRRGEGNGRRGGRDRDRGERDRGERDRGRDRDRDRRRPRYEDEELPRRREPVAAEVPEDEPVSPAEMVGQDAFAIVEADRVDELAIVTPERAPDEVPPVAESRTAVQAEEEGLPPAVGEAPAPEAEEAAAETPPAEAEEAPEPEAERGKRRSRSSRGRGRRTKSSEPAADAEGPAKEPPGPEPMGSAEHRTNEDNPPRPPLPSPVDFTDDDLSFSRARRPEPEPVREEPPPRRQTPPEPEAEEEEVETPTGDHDWQPPAHEEDDEFEPLCEEHEPAVAEAPPPEEEEFDDDYAEQRMSDFEEDEEERPRRRSRRDDRGGRDRDHDRGRRGRRPGGGRPGMGRPKPLIQDIFKRGQEVLVQVIKEGIGTKGPTLSTYISIAGRYLVLMPGLNRIGVSRKIADDEQRRRLREILNELQPPKGLGFIIRTAGLDRTKKELQRDLAYLSRLWQVVVRRIRKMKAPAEIYQESDMIIRTIRDTFTSEIDTIWVDERTAFEHAQEFLQIVMPRYANRIKCYTDTEPMFHKYGIEEEIARIQRRHVPLPHGGSIVIDQTEALVAIDVNSGNFRADNNAEETAYQMNLHAAREIARQLRLRDLGGVIVNDFIDMRDEKHRRGVEKAMRDAVKRDRARTKILKISQFGIIEMTRQRIRPSLKRSVYQDCPHCSGTGQVKTTESMSIDVMRMLQLAAHRPNIQRIEIRVHQDVASYLLNRKRKAINGLEESGNTTVHITGELAAAPEMLEFVCYDVNNNEVKFLPGEENHRPRRR
jgi:ribonuclease E